MVRSIVSKALPVVLALLLCSAMHAQTYTQTQSTSCRIATLQCQNIPMSGGNSFTFDGPFTFLSEGNQVYWDGVLGQITVVTQQAPGVPWNDGKTGPYGFKFALNDGRTGVASGVILITRAGRWPVAVVQATAVTF